MAQKPAPKPTGGGLLQIPASATQKNSPQSKNASSNSTSAKPSNAAAPRLKLLVRRLPPGLTKAEFETAMGEEWRVGSGKVDYFLYKEGKVSKDPSKPSRPSRAYLRVTSAPLIQVVSDKVRSTSFLDARNTSLDPALLGPPYVEYAPFARVPGGKVRKDARMGTIDQDPEFIAFLESLTNPVPKAASIDEGNSEADEKEREEREKEKENAAITPLIQFLREKKANKAREKEAAAIARKEAKIARERERVEKSQAKRVLSRADKEKEREKEKQKLDKATKDAVKAANKVASQPAAGKGAASAKDVAPPTAPAAERRRERGSLAAATKILRRDLGLAPASPRGRRGEKAAATPEKADDKGPASPTATTPPKAPNTLKGKQENAAPKGRPAKKEPPTEPAAARNAKGTPAKQPPAPKKQSQAQAEPAQPTPPSGNTQAFLKHANPSQGVTEPLLQSGFSQFGTVTRVEIDRKKGFGYVDFADAESLQRAIKASPVQIAQSNVVVLERKDGGRLREERSRNRGGGQNQNQSQQPQPQQPAMAPAPSPPLNQPVPGPVPSPAAQARAPPQGPRGGRGPRKAFGGGRGYRRQGGQGGNAGNANAGQGAAQGQGNPPTGPRGGRR